MNAAKRMPKQHFALISRRILALHWHRAIRVSVSGRPAGVYLDLPANVLAATMEKDEALNDC